MLRTLFVIQDSSDVGPKLTAMFVFSRLKRSPQKDSTSILQSAVAFTKCGLLATPNAKPEEAINFSYWG
jgi:hypothetical protein